MGKNEVCLEIIFRADAIFVGRWKGFKNAFSETVVEFDLGHDDDSVWQVQDFGCLGLIFSWQAQYFVGLNTSTKKWLRPR